MWHVCICLLVLVPFLVLCLGENFLKYCYYDSLLFSRMREWFCDVVSITVSPSCLSPSSMKWQMKWHSSFVGYFCLMFRSSRPPTICFFVQWVLHDCDRYLSQIYSCCLSLILVVESVHLKPASLSVFHHIGHLSVSTGLKVSCSLPTTCPMCKTYPTATCPMCKTYPTATCPMCKTNPTMTRSVSEMNPFNQNTVLSPVSCSVKISLPLVLIHVSNVVKFS